MRLLLVLLGVAACGAKSKAIDAAEEPSRSDAAADSAAPRDVPQSAPTIVYVVRHVEAATPTGDPSPTDAGVARAERLAAWMADKQLGAIDATQFKRTQETGKVVADAMGLAVELVPVDPANVAAYPALIAAHVKQQHAGQAILVVGHTTTVPGTVEALSGTPVPPISMTEYDRLYTITIAADGSARLESGTY